jgi:hypothetical protein
MQVAAGPSAERPMMMMMMMMMHPKSCTGPSSDHDQLIRVRSPLDPLLSDPLMRPEAEAEDDDDDDDDDDDAP